MSLLPPNLHFWSSKQNSSSGTALHCYSSCSWLGMVIRFTLVIKNQSLRFCQMLCGVFNESAGLLLVLDYWIKLHWKGDISIAHTHQFGFCCKFINCKYVYFRKISTPKMYKIWENCLRWLAHPLAFGLFLNSTLRNVNRTLDNILYWQELKVQFVASFYFIWISFQPLLNLRRGQFSLNILGGGSLGDLVSDCSRQHPYRTVSSCTGSVDVVGVWSPWCGLHLDQCLFCDVLLHIEFFLLCKVMSLLVL